MLKFSKLIFSLIIFQMFVFPLQTANAAPWSNYFKEKAHEKTLAKEKLYNSNDLQRFVRIGNTSTQTTYKRVSTSGYFDDTRGGVYVPLTFGSEVSGGSGSFNIKSDLEAAQITVKGNVKFKTEGGYVVNGAYHKTCPGWTCPGGKISGKTQNSTFTE